MSTLASDRRLGSPDEPGAVHVGLMKRRHLRSVLRIEERSNPRPWSFNLFLSELRYSESRVYLVARSGGEVVGFAGLMLVAGDGHITNIGVDPDHRRQGVATRLLLVLARRAIAEGADALTLEVRMSNTAAQDLYRTFGFVPAGVRKNYYSDANEDALIMWANDIDEPHFHHRLAEIDAALPTPTVLEAM